MLLNLTLAAVITGCYLWSGITDWKRRQISNRCLLILLIAGLAMLGLRFFHIPSVIFHEPGILSIIKCTGTFLVLFYCWMKKKIGGGDVKLMTLTNLIFPLSELFGIYLIVLIASVPLAVYCKHTCQTTRIPLGTAFMAGVIPIVGYTVLKTLNAVI